MDRRNLRLRSAGPYVVRSVSESLQKAKVLALVPNQNSRSFYVWCSVSVEIVCQCNFLLSLFFSLFHGFILYEGISCRPLDIEYVYGGLMRYLCWLHPERLCKTIGSYFVGVRDNLKMADVSQFDML